MGWLDDTELRIGLGCVRVPDDRPIVAAAAGITVFDTARAYSGNEQPHRRSRPPSRRRSSVQA